MAHKRFLLFLFGMISIVYSQGIFSSNLGASSSYEQSPAIGLRSNESLVNIYSNIVVADIYVWSTPWLNTERTFPAQIILPLDNQQHVISLYSKQQFTYIANELQNFDFENKDIAEFEALQNQLELMQLGTKTVRPIPGSSDEIFLVYCDEKDLNCAQGLHWFDKFYSSHLDAKQEQNMISDLNGENLTEAEQLLVRKHRTGVASMLSLFTLGLFLIDNLGL